MSDKTKTLAVITGPTGSGKSALAVDVAEALCCEIISADSRQIFKGLPIGTAAPTAEQKARVKHQLVEMLDLEAYYSAAQFETDALTLFADQWRCSDYAVMCGGSLMYVDAVCNGIDELPTVSDEIRAEAYKIYHDGGLEAIQAELKRLDPDTYMRIDLNNHKRIVHAVEITMQAGIPYSRLCTGNKKERPFRIVKMAINYPREELFERINRRVDAMIEAGLEEEALKVYPQRHLNSLNTVGYKELFAVIDGTMPRDVAIERIKKNTRVYAKKQLTWLKRDPHVNWLDPSQPLLPQALNLIKQR